MQPKICFSYILCNFSRISFVTVARFTNSCYYTNCVHQRTISWWKGAPLPPAGPVTAHSCLWGCCDSQNWPQGLLFQGLLSAAEQEWYCCRGKGGLEATETQTVSGALEQAVSVLGDNCPEKSGVSKQLWDLFLSSALQVLIVTYWGLLFVHFTGLLWNLLGWAVNAVSSCFQKRKKYGLQGCLQI